MELLQRVRTGIEINEGMHPLPDIAAGSVMLEFSTTAPTGTVSWLLGLVTTSGDSGGAELAATKVTFDNPSREVYAITAPVTRLLSAAEQFKMQKLGTDGSMHEFTIASRFRFETFSDETAESFFTTSECQWLVKQCLESIDVSTSTHVPGYPAIKTYKDRPIVPVCTSAKILKIYPLHDVDELKTLTKKLFLTHKPWPFPIDDVRRYFGDHVALYFTFLGFYTKFLIPPCVIVLVSRVMFADDKLEDNVWFAAINLIWATLFLEIWKRKSSEVAFSWALPQTDTGLSEALQHPRAEFDGENRVSPITGNVEPYYPWWKRTLKMYCVSYPLLLLCLGFAVCGMWLYLEFQRTMTQRLLNHHSFTALILKRLPSTLYSGAIFASNNAYNRVAKRLNQWENHRFQSTYDSHLIIKLILFYSVNGFLSLFYIAFYLQDMVLLRQHLATLLITQQLIQQVQESLIPYLKYKRHSVKVTADGTKLQLQRSDAENRVEQESRLPSYQDTFGDYLELYLQFGYVFLFSAAYPLASFWAVLNNIIEMKSDAFKLCHLFQRPFNERVSSIGAWQHAFEIMSIVAVVTNCALIAMSEHTKGLFKGLTTTEYVLLFVLVEHCLIAIKVMIAYVIPDTPGWIRKKIAKAAYQHHTVLKEIQRRNAPVVTASPKSQSSKDD